MKPTVLVVDDDDDVRAVTVAGLRDRFHVLEAENGRRALELLEHEPIDVVVTDVIMPGISGFHVMRSAKRCRPAPKVLLVSGFASALVDAQLPPGSFLPKPFRLAELERAVERLIES
ncbi:MAG: response regulator [Rhodospirillales bacterium]|nr:response regulator [Rhodospirillales bacterium]